MLIYKTTGTFYSHPILKKCFYIGMVSVCAGCDAYNAWTAVILGTISSVIYLMLSLILVSFKVDDPLDAFAIHFGGGIYIP